MFNFSSVRRPATIALALTASIAMVACGDKTTPKPTPTVTAVTVAPTTATLAIGATTKPTATVTGTNSPATTVTWTSDKTAVATVNSTTGVVTAVSAGTAVIKATSTVNTTKFGTITVTVTPGGGASTKKINFAPAAQAVDGFDTNSGAQYNGTMGWVTEDTADTTMTPLNMTGNVRPTTAITVAGAEAAQLTQINMQCGTPTTGGKCASGTLVSGAFIFPMADGKYNVTVSVGDASASTNANNTNSLHTINVEGTNIINNFAPTQAKLFMKATKEVTVTGGKVTVDAKGGKNTKINYIIMEPVN